MGKIGLPKQHAYLRLMGRFACADLAAPPQIQTNKPH